MKRLILALACTAVAVAPTPARAATLTIPAAITVLGTNVFAGPTFTVSGNFSVTDYFAMEADGEVGLAGSNFYNNAAGIVTRPGTTNTGAHPGQVSPASGGSVAPGLPYGALFIGNNTVGFHQVFQANAANGLGSATPPLALSVNRTIGDLFGASIANGTVLMFRINDINTGDNSGGFRLSPVPEPATLALLAFGLATGVVRRRTR